MSSTFWVLIDGIGQVLRVCWIIILGLNLIWIWVWLALDPWSVAAFVVAISSFRLLPLIWLSVIIFFAGQYYVTNSYAPRAWLFAGLVVVIGFMLSALRPSGWRGMAS